MTGTFSPKGPIWGVLARGYFDMGTRGFGALKRAFPRASPVTLGLLTSTTRLHERGGGLLGL